MKPWPKFIRSIDNGSGVWSVYDCFDVSGVKTITVKYMTTSGTEKISYFVTNTYPDRAFVSASSNLKHDTQETAASYAYKTFDVSNYKYWGVALRDSGNMSYNIDSVT